MSPALDAKFSVKKAHNAQRLLCQKIITEDKLPKKIKRIAGVDVSYFDDKCVGCVVVLDFDSLEVLETQSATCRTRIPYIPTLLSFREMSPAIACIKKLKLLPDVFLIDAQGLAHPYRCGFASHLGLALGKPTVGVAKSRLIGEPVKVDDKVLLIDKDEVVGEVLTTKKGSKPLYVSVGHMISLETAIEVIKHCSRDRIPEPLLQAHRLATKEKNVYVKRPRTASYE